jgi:hypothetical protein
MEMQFGPQTELVERFIGQVENLTAEQVGQLADQWEDVLDDLSSQSSIDWYAASAAARYAATDAGRGTAWNKARRAARDATWDAWNAPQDAGMDEVDVRHAAWYTSDATVALVVRDLITPGGFTDERYKLLTGPCVSVFPNFGEEITNG